MRYPCTKGFRTRQHWNPALRAAPVGGYSVTHAAANIHIALRGYIFC
jgi:hypothetical protein